MVNETEDTESEIRIVAEEVATRIEEWERELSYYGDLNGQSQVFTVGSTTLGVIPINDGVFVVRGTPFRRRDFAKSLLEIGAGSYSPYAYMETLELSAAEAQALLPGLLDLVGPLTALALIADESSGV